MNNHPQIANIPAICAAHGVKHAIISPGSRNALLSIGFSREKSIQTLVIPDERSAAFIGLGMAQSTKTPVVIVCTSGSALLNYYPAIAEAYFSHIPLIVISADRPDEWVGQRDGQTINQKDVLRNHVKKSYHLPVNTEHQDAAYFFNRMVNEAIIHATSSVFGPVHINIPIREPFYSSINNSTSTPIKVIKKVKPTANFTWTPDLIDAWKSCTNKLLIAGQADAGHYSTLNSWIVNFPEEVIVLDEPMSNLGCERSMNHHDLFLNQLSEDGLSSYSPDLLITVGRGMISKGLKRLLRRFPPTFHWHFSDTAEIEDTYQSITHLFPLVGINLLEQLGKSENDSSFIKIWKEANKKTRKELYHHFEEEQWDEISASHYIFNQLDSSMDLHVSNSMPVRYACFIGAEKADAVYCNRGTSGIDGCTSTMIGHAIGNSKKQVLLTGDQSFFYDINALWHNHLPSNFGIVIINNNGGGIFRMIDGPSEITELDRMFVAGTGRNAKGIAAEFNLSYIPIQQLNQLKDVEFNSIKWPFIIEIFINGEENTKEFKKLKHKIKQALSQ